MILYCRVARFFSATAPKLKSKSAKMRHKISWKRHLKRHNFSIIYPFFGLFVKFGVHFFTPKNLLPISDIFFVILEVVKPFYVFVHFGMKFLSFVNHFLAVFGHILLLNLKKKLLIIFNDFSAVFVFFYQSAIFTNFYYWSTIISANLTVKAP